MSDDRRIWFKQDVTEVFEEWLNDDLPVGARWAYQCLKAYIKVYRPSQKRHSRAPVKGHRAAAREWNVAVEDVTLLIETLIRLGKLRIEGDEWVLSDLSVCAHEDTVRRNSQTDTPQTNVNEDQEDICAANDSKSEQTGAPCHVTVTETVTDTVVLPSEEITDRASALFRFDAGWLIDGVPVAPTDEEMDDAVAALGRKPEASDGMLYWHTGIGPIRDVGLALSWANVLMGQPAPDARKPPRYVGETQGCRQAVDRKGWKRAAEIYEWAVRKGKTTSWTTLNDQIDAYETQMVNGTEWVDKKPAPIVRAAPQSLGDKNDKLSRELLDRMLKRNEITEEEYENAISKLGKAA